MEHHEEMSKMAGTVPLVDKHKSHLVYHPSLLWKTLIGAGIGGILFALIGYALSGGPLPIAELGQFAASGDGVAAFVGAGFGVSVGGLTGAFVALTKPA